MMSSDSPTSACTQAQNFSWDICRSFAASHLQDRVIGILDWELSTLGNQMCDVAYSCLVLMSIATPMTLFYICY